MSRAAASAANSAVCYCLGITPVDRSKIISVRNGFQREPQRVAGHRSDLPSGDRREAVIRNLSAVRQTRCSLTANVITYRGRSAAREIGKALNFSPSIIDGFSRICLQRRFPAHVELEAQIEAGRSPKHHPRMPAFIRLYHAILRLPATWPAFRRYDLFVRTNSARSCAGNASMPGRVVAQWTRTIA